MKTKVKLSLVLLSVFLGTSIGYSQDKNEKKANEKFDNYAYSDAIDTYEDLVADGYNNEDIYKRLGNANYLNASHRLG